MVRPNLIAGPPVQTEGMAVEEVRTGWNREAGMAREAFAPRLREAMECRGFKQVDLVRAAQGQGVKLGKSHMSQYVAGKTVPR